MFSCSRHVTRFAGKFLISQCRSDSELLFVCRGTDSSSEKGDDPEAVLGCVGVGGGGEGVGVWFVGGSFCGGGVLGGGFGCCGRCTPPFLLGVMS